MKRVAIIVSLLVGGSLWLAGTASAEDLKPVSAAEAEGRVAQSRDALTDMLWIGIDAYWHEGDWNSCLRLCNNIIEVDPTFIEAYTSAAWMLWSSDRDKEAIAMYENGLKANPDSADLYFEYGFYRRYRKQYEQAVPLLRKAAEKGATRGQQHLLPAVLYEMGHKQEALDEWRAVLKRFPNDPIAKMKVARLEAEVAAEQNQDAAKEKPAK